MACCYLAWVSLRQFARQAAQTIYQAHQQQWAPYLRQLLAKPLIPALLPDECVSPINIVSSPTAAAAKPSYCHHIAGADGQSQNCSGQEYTAADPLHEVGPG